MKKFRSHKIVEAATIIAQPLPPTSLGVAVEGGEIIYVPESFFARGVPKIGDYLVRYEDGYLSFSPKKAFEDGYTEVDETYPFHETGFVDGVGIVTRKQTEPK